MARPVAAGGRSSVDREGAGEAAFVGLRELNRRSPRQPLGEPSEFRGGAIVSTGCVDSTMPSDRQAANNVAILKPAREAIHWGQVARASANSFARIWRQLLGEERERRKLQVDKQTELWLSAIP